MVHNEQKSLTISTIPILKLTVLMNNFICNTITHLNKWSVKGDEKLAEFDKKLNDLEIMTIILEAKLNSLPEKITSTYPQLQQCSLDDLNLIINNNPVPSSNIENDDDSGKGEPIPPPEPCSSSQPVQINEDEEKKKKTAINNLPKGKKMKILVLMKLLKISLKTMKILEFYIKC